MQCRGATACFLTFGILTEFLRGFSQSLYLLKACNSATLCFSPTPLLTLLRGLRPNFAHGGWGQYGVSVIHPAAGPALTRDKVTSKFTLSSREDRKERKRKENRKEEKKGTTNPERKPTPEVPNSKRNEEGLSYCHYRPKCVLQHGWAGVGLPHHILLPTERWQEAHMGQIP